MAGRQVNELPSVVLLDGIPLLLHRSLPSRIFLSFGESAGFTGVRQM